MSEVDQRTASAAELANAFFDAFNDDGIEAAIVYLAPDIVAHSAPGWAGKPLYGGHDGARELAAEWTARYGSTSPGQRRS